MSSSSGVALAVRKRRGRKHLKLERVPLHRCETINQVWEQAAKFRGYPKARAWSTS